MGFLVERVLQEERVKVEMMGLLNPKGEHGYVE